MEASYEYPKMQAPPKVTVLEPTLENLQFIRSLSTPERRLYTFDRDDLSIRLQNDQAFKQAFYNKEIFVHLSTDGQVGHVSATLPTVDDEGNIVIKRFIGLEPQEGSKTILPIFSRDVVYLHGLILSIPGISTGPRIKDKGVFVAKERSQSEKLLITKKIPITEETYRKMAIEVRKRIIDSGTDYVIYGIRGGNCVSYNNNLLQHCGIASGLHNLFTKEEIDKLNFKAVLLPVRHHLDEIVTELHSLTFSPEEYQLEQQYLKKRESEIQARIDRDNENTVKYSILDFLYPEETTAPNIMYPDARYAAYEYIKNPELEKEILATYGLLPVGEIDGETVFAFAADAPINNINIADLTPEAITEFIAQERVKISGQYYPQMQESDSTIKDIKFGKIAGGMGVGLTFILNSGSAFSIGTTTSSPGLVVSFETPLTEEFLAAIAASTPLVVTFLATAFVTKHFFDERNKSINRKIKADVAITKSELKKLNNIFKDLDNEMQKEDLSEILLKTNKALRATQQEIEFINKRKQTTNKYNRKEIGAGYAETRINLRNAEANLANLKRDLEIKVALNNFQEKTQDYTISQLLEEVETLAGQKNLKESDYCVLQLAKDLIFNHANCSISKGEYDAAKEIFTRADQINFYKPGTLPEFKSPYRTIKTQVFVGYSDIVFQEGKHIAYINKKTQEINSVISDGGDPRALFIEVEDYVTREFYFHNMCAQSELVNEQFKEYFQLFQEWYNEFSSLKEAYANGNSKQNLDFSNNINLVNELISDQNKPFPYWLEIIKNNLPTTTDESNLITENDALSLSFALHTAFEKLHNLFYNEDFKKTLEYAEQLKLVFKNDAPAVLEIFITEIKNYEKNTNKPYSFWLNRIITQDRISTASDEVKANIVNALAAKRLALIVLKKFKERSFAEAKQIQKKLNEKIPGLIPSEAINNLHYLENKQLIQVFMPQLHTLVAAVIDNLQQGWIKNIASFGYDMVNICSTLSFNPLQTIFEGCFAYHHGYSRLFTEGFKDNLLATKDAFFLKSGYESFYLWWQILSFMIQRGGLVIEKLPQLLQVSMNFIGDKLIPVGTQVVRAVSVYNLIESTKNTLEAPLGIFAGLSFGAELSFKLMHFGLASEGLAIESPNFYILEDVAHIGISATGGVLTIYSARKQSIVSTVLFGAATVASLLLKIFGNAGSPSERAINGALSNISYNEKRLLKNINNFKTPEKQEEYSDWCKREVNKSFANIDSILCGTYGGISYNPKQSDIINYARSMHCQIFYQYTDILKLDIFCNNEGKVIADKKYKLPAFMVMSLIFNKLLSVIDNDIDSFNKLYKLALKAKDQMPSSCNIDVKSEILIYLKKILEYAVMQLIIAAKKSNTSRKIEFYLDSIKELYDISYDKTILSTEQKEEIARLYNLIGCTQKANKFSSGIGGESLGKLEEEEPEPNTDSNSGANPTSDQDSVEETLIPEQLYAMYGYGNFVSKAQPAEGHGGSRRRKRNKKSPQNT